MFVATTHLWRHLGLSYDDIYRHHSPRSTHELIERVTEARDAD